MEISHEFIYIYLYISDGECIKDIWEKKQGGQSTRGETKKGER